LGIEVVAGTGVGAIVSKKEKSAEAQGSEACVREGAGTVAVEVLFVYGVTECVVKLLDNDGVFEVGGLLGVGMRMSSKLIRGRSLEDRMFHVCELGSGGEEDMLRLDDF